MKLISSKILMGVAGLSLGLIQANAVDLSLGYEFSGAQTPSGPVVVKLEQDGADRVKVTIDANQLSGAEYVNGVYLNYGGTATLSFESFTQTEGTGADLNSATYSSNAYKADGDGYFDILIDFPPPGGDNKRVEAGDVVTLIITGSGITVNDFVDYLSQAGPGSDPKKIGFVAAAHVGGIGPDGEGSGWVTVPEPSTYVAGALLLLPVLAQIRRWRRSIA